MLNEYEIMAVGVDEKALTAVQRVMSLENAAEWHKLK